MEVKNPRFTADGRIDCDFLHPAFGWIPFTADPNDCEILGRAIFEYALQLGPEPYAPAPDQTGPV